MDHDDFVGLFVLKLLKWLLLVPFLYLGFAMGNCGWGGWAILCLITLLMSTFVGTMSTFGFTMPGRNAAWQGFLVVINAIIFLTAWLVYICTRYYDSKLNPGFQECWDYWKHLPPHWAITLACWPLLAILLAFLGTCWVSAFGEEK